MTNIRRRDFLRCGAATLGASMAPRLVVGNVGSAPHPHPHQGSYSPSHNLSGVGLEHSFMQAESLNYASMLGCRIIVEHHEPVPLHGFEQFAGVTEHVPFFVSSKNRIGNLTVGQMQRILSGEITDWSEVGGGHSALKVCANGYNKRWRKAFWRVVGHSGHGGFEELMRSLEDRGDHDLAGSGTGPATLVFGSGYREAATWVARDPAMLGVGLRPAFARGMGLVPVMVDGWDFRSEDYPIQVPTYFHVRSEAEGASTGADLIVAHLTRMYQEDLTVVEEEQW